MKKKLICCAMSAIMVFGFCLTMTGCGSKGDSGSSDEIIKIKTVYVAEDGSDKADGSEQKPYATIAKALDEARAGTEIIVGSGTYDSFSISSKQSGTPDNPIILRAEDGEMPFIQGIEGSPAVSFKNVHDFVMKGFEISGGSYGIYYKSTEAAGEDGLDNIIIEDCHVHDIYGSGGICVKGENDLAPVQGIVIDGCDLYNCYSDDNETLTIAGNIDSITVSNNTIHDNGDAGINMVGVVNGECRDNLIYNISDDAIAVDAGQSIKVFNNFVFNCETGVEITSKKKSTEDETFESSGIKVRDNIIADNSECGLCFGGHGKEKGMTKDSIFCSNTLIDNHVQIGVERSTGNEIRNNLIIGGDEAIEFSDKFPETEMDNTFGKNVWCMDEGMEIPVPANAMKKQVSKSDRDEVLDGMTSLVEGFGSTFVPGKEAMKIYKGK